MEALGKELKRARRESCLGNKQKRGAATRRLQVLQQCQGLLALDSTLSTERVRRHRARQSKRGTHEAIKDVVVVGEVYLAPA